MSQANGWDSKQAVRAAVVQMDVRLGENDLNLSRILEKLNEAASHGATLVVFPECALSGYCFDSLAEALPFAEANHARLASFANRCMTLGVTGVLGFLERVRGIGGATDEEIFESREEIIELQADVEAVDVVHNSAFLAPMTYPNDNGVYAETYQKTHLPTLGVDRFVQPGEYLAVHQTAAGNIGLLICYDIRFPEAARTLGLQGADVIALPTNWPEGAESAPEFITRSRAWESRVYVLAANRVGVERGRKFIGRSQIVSPAGEILAEAGPDDETILYADLDFSLVRNKRIVIEAGEWELDITADRRPELYHRLTADIAEKP